MHPVALSVFVGLLPACLLAAAKGPPPPQRQEGQFKLVLKGTPVCTVSYTWEADGRYRARRTLAVCSQSLTTTLTVEPDAAGRWKQVLIEKPGDTVRVVRRDGQAVVTRRGRHTAHRLQPKTELWESLSPALLRRLVLRCNAERGRPQEVPVYCVGGRAETATVIELAAPPGAEGVRAFKLALAGVDLLVQTDAAGRVLRVDMPAQYAFWVRVGHESLRPAAQEAPGVSRPEREVELLRNVEVPMRDGVALATDLYRPKTAGRTPVILLRTPYKKETAEIDARDYAARGYTCAVQDCRGRFASPGRWEPFVNEAEDGYDTIEWLAAQPWATGKVGMIGASYLGWVQWWALSQKPPHLTTMVPNVSPPDPFYNVPYEYGVFFLTGAIMWADVVQSEATASLDTSALERIGTRRYSQLLRSLPVIDLDKKVLGRENPYWRAWIAHPTNDAYWERANFLGKLEGAAIPVFHQSGWFDADGIGTKLNYLRMRAHGHPQQKLILGPWGHSAQAHRRLFGRDFGPEAIIDLRRLYLRWFDHWLKGVDNGIADEPLVRLFIMGTNRWVRGQQYPLKVTRFEKWHLASGGHANTSKGDGTLTRDEPPENSPTDRYVYDPMDPTPDPQYWERPEHPEGATLSADELRAARRARPAQIAASREDILVYTSPPFAQPTTFVGPVSAVLYAATSARDTDWFVTLSKVDGEGEVFPLAQGKLRARFRRSTSRPSLLTPGRVYKYHLDLWHTGITVPAGHRLRVEVASAAFPTFSRNLNTGGHNETETRAVKAEQTLHHSRRRPSHVLLPAIPATEVPGHGR